MPQNGDWMEKIYPYRFQVVCLLLGILFFGIGVFLYKGNLLSQPSIEIVNEDVVNIPNENNASGDIVVEVSGSVASPGVYKLPKGSRIEDALLLAGGISEIADKTWMDKFLNRAAVISDGQKIYIPSNDEQVSTQSANEMAGGVQGSQTSTESVQNRVNINTASQSELESLWGIGPVTAKSIIDQRVYSSVEELLTKGILKKNVYERNKDLLSVY